MAFWSAAAAANPTILFDQVNVIDMADGRVIADQDVLVRGDLIIATGPAIQLPDGALRIDGEGLFLLPGLAEMHAHIPPTTQQRQVRDTLALYLANGLTTLRGMLGEPGHLKLREQQQLGKLEAPRIYVAGPSMNGNSVRSPTEAVAQVKAFHKAGYDLLKIHPGISLDAYRALAAEARRLAMPFAGHVPAEVGAWRAIGAGQASIDHMDGYVEALTPNGRLQQLPPSFFNYLAAPHASKGKVGLLIAALTDRKVWTVPTESLMHRYAGLESVDTLLARDEMQYVAPRTRRAWAQRLTEALDDPSFDADAARQFIQLRLFLIRRLHESGAGLVLGSDAPQTFQVPGFSIHDELAIYVQAGLTPFEALRTGTVNVAQYFGVEDQRGLVTPGHAADLVLLRANPLLDIANTRRIAGVMVAGRWYDGEWIDRKLADISAGYRQAD